MTWRHLRPLALSPEALLWRLRMPATPVDVFGVAAALSVRVLEARTSPRWASALDHPPGHGAVVWVRPADRQVHRRFSVAHALAHLLIPSHPLGLRLEVTYLDGEEDREANRWALRLLIPDGLLRRHLAHQGTNPHTIADAFRVSEAAATARLQLSASRPSSSG